MKKIKILLIALMIFIVGLLSGCLKQDQRVCARKLDDIPESYTSMTEGQIEVFPHLKEAIMQCKITGNMTCISTPEKEFNKAMDFFKDTSMYIEYQNEYYELSFNWEIKS